MSANKYTPCGGFIIAANDEKFAVETPHPLPLPEGIEPNEDVPRGKVSAVAFSRKDGCWTAMMHEGATHWLARRPLPEVPKVKTQEELDEEFMRGELMYLSACLVNRIPMVQASIERAIAYARKCPAKPAA